MNAPASFPKPTARDLLTPADRLKAFSDAVQAALDTLNEDTAYADSDMALCRTFSAFEVAKETLVAECETFLKHGPVGNWPKRGGSYADYLA